MGHKTLGYFVTWQQLLHPARHCIGCKWPMDQMCSKHEKHCFSHDIWKISELWKISENFILSKFVFFIEYFLDKMFFWQFFFKEFFTAFKTITLY